MAGFVIAIAACLVPFALGALGLGRVRVMIIGLVFCGACLIGLASKPPTETAQVPFWFLGGMVVLLYVIWCGGVWLGARVRRMRQATPG
jgi:hypothetical protein